MGKDIGWCDCEARTPHYRSTLRELSVLAERLDSGMTFTDEEKEMYAGFRANPVLLSQMENDIASSVDMSLQGK